MDARITEIRPMVADGWARQEQTSSQSPEARQIKPVPKNEGSGLGRLSKEHKNPQAIQEKVEPMEREDLENLVQDMENYLSDMRVNLSFKLHDETGDVLVQVIDGETGEVIRQLPPEEILELREKLKELRGVIFDSKV